MSYTELAMVVLLITAIAGVGWALLEWGDK